MVGLGGGGGEKEGGSIGGVMCQDRGAWKLDDDIQKDQSWNDPLRGVGYDTYLSDGDDFDHDDSWLVIGWYTMGFYCLVMLVLLERMMVSINITFPFILPAFLQPFIFMSDLM